MPQGRSSPPVPERPSLKPPTDHTLGTVGVFARWLTASYLRRAAELLIFGGRKAVSDNVIDDWER